VQTIKELIYSDEIRILGSPEQLKKARSIIDALQPLLKTEAQARLMIQDAIDEHHLNASILYKGNRVWSRRKILRNLKRIMENGALYKDKNKRVRWLRISDTICLPKTPANFKPILSKYFYEFLTLCCGSSAHYSREGWIGIYPRLEDLKSFFQKNEHGKPVSEWIPEWKADAKRIVDDIERILFPFRNYVKSRQKRQGEMR